MIKAGNVTLETVNVVTNTEVTVIVFLKKIKIFISEMKVVIFLHLSFI